MAHILIDSRCTKAECDITRLVEQLQATFPKIQLNQIDYATDDGKKFYEEYNLTFIPAVLFEPGVKESDSFSQVENYLKESNGLYSLAIGASVDPTKEICDNEQDDTGNEEKTTGNPHRTAEIIPYPLVDDRQPPVSGKRP